MSDRFNPVVVCDFEYEADAGELPTVLCMVAHVLDENLRHVRTVRLWRGEFGSAPPFDVGPGALFVAYSAWAELTCFMTLGWEFPEHVLDLHTAYLATSNVLLPHDPFEKRKRQGKRLPDACRAYGIEGWERIDKDSIARDIGEGNWRTYGREAVSTYCAEDVAKTVQLLRAQLGGWRDKPPIDVPRVLHWSNYSAKAIAKVQAKGMPIDMPLWNLVQENKSKVISELLRKFDPSHGGDDPIYTPDGSWSYDRFERWLIAIGVNAWPRLDSGQLDLEGDTFRMMYHVPGIEGLTALRDSLGVIVKATLPIGRDGRNRPSLFPFCTTTGRNAHARSLYNAHAGMRSFMAFPEDTIATYLDFRTQEVAVAAALSQDQNLIDSYLGGDVYYTLARDGGLTTDLDQAHWKKHHPDMRQRMKSLQLGINYGMEVPSLARGLDRHPYVASFLIEQHRRKYARFWDWRANMVQVAMLEREMKTVLGWPIRISTSPNRRTLYNFPMQGNGAEMLRLAAQRLCEVGLVPSMLVHDGILLELRSEEEMAHAIEIMRWAGREVCYGMNIDVDVDQ